MLYQIRPVLRHIHPAGRLFLGAFETKSCKMHPLLAPVCHTAYKELDNRLAEFIEIWFWALFWNLSACFSSGCNLTSASCITYLETYIMRFCSHPKRNSLSIYRSEKCFELKLWVKIVYTLISTQFLSHAVFYIITKWAIEAESLSSAYIS